MRSINKKGKKVVGVMVMILEVRGEKYQLTLRSVFMVLEIFALNLSMIEIRRGSIPWLRILDVKEYRWIGKVKDS